jgi:hypothetical protein
MRLILPERARQQKESVAGRRPSHHGAANAKKIDAAEGKNMDYKKRNSPSEFRS